MVILALISVSNHPNATEIAGWIWPVAILVFITVFFNQKSKDDSWREIVGAFFLGVIMYKLLISALGK